MELFIAVIMAGMIAYELYSGELIVKNGVRAKTLSRHEYPGTFWFWVVVQAAVIVWMLLEWFGIIHTGIFS